jgi:hypothetical protein
MKIASTLSMAFLAGLSRSGEVRFATAAEFDKVAAVWTVPGRRNGQSTEKDAWSRRRVACWMF